MNTEPIDYEKLSNILIGRFVYMFGEECEKLIEYPKSCGFGECCQEYGLLPNGHRGHVHVAYIFENDIKNMSPYIQDKMNAMSKKFKGLDMKNPDHNVLRELIFWSKKMCDEIIKDNQIDIETTVFISPSPNFQSACYSIYHNTRLCALSPLDYGVKYMSLFLPNAFGLETGIGIGAGLVNQTVNIVYSKAFEDYYNKIHYDERGKIIPIDMRDVKDFETMGIDGSDFIDMSEVARATDCFCAGSIAKEILSKLKEKNRHNFLEKISSVIPL